MGIFDRLDKLASGLGDLILPDEVRAHVELGAAYLERGDVAAARRELELATELRPDHQRAQYLLGLARLRAGEPDLALAALAMAPSVADARLLEGELYRRQGDLPAAGEAFRAAIESNLDEPTLRGEAHRGLGAVYLGEGRVDRAVRELRKAAAALPDDAEAQSLLGRALLARGDHDNARLALEKAALRDRPDGPALVALAETYAVLERYDDARAAFERATTLSGDLPTDARVGLARLLLSLGDAPAAHDQIVRAMGSAVDRPDLLALHGKILVAMQSWGPALAAFDRALVEGAGHPQAKKLLFDRRPVLEEALRTALRGRLWPRVEAYAIALEQERTQSALAQAARAALALEAGQLDEAERRLDASLAIAETPEALGTQGELLLRRDQGGRARQALRRALELRPSDAHARELLIAQWHQPPVGDRLEDLLRAAHGFFAHNPELADLAPALGHQLEVLDRPLLVTVMGEFNAGKSSFVNALLGESVAPVGVTPTTATINVLKYGAEPKGRLVYRDGTSRDVAWKDVSTTLRLLKDAEIRQLRLVEVLYPLEFLQRVNVVDTPGLNSLNPEHEQTARAFIAEADAVVWLFTVDQAAKATEGAALATIGQAGKKVLGVVNKIDRADPEERDKILAHIQSTVGDRLEAIVPFSARLAVEARAQKDDSKLAESNYAGLLAALEDRFFSRSRAIKAAACRARFVALLEEATARATKARAQLDRDESASLESNLRGERLLFERELLPAEKRQLNLDASEVYSACASEVLEFVRPRRWVFGSNEATPADRDFLVGVLEERLFAILDQSRRRLGERALAVAAMTAPLGRLYDPTNALRLLDEQVYGRYRAFARGYLRGGRVDEFFTRVLPKLELSEASLARALDRSAPWSEEIVDRELLTPLRDWARRYFEGLLDHLAAHRAKLQFARLELDERLLYNLAQSKAALQT